MIIRILLLTVITLRLSAQQFSRALFLGAGGVVTAQEGIFALQDNPAGITLTKSATADIGYRQHFATSKLIKGAMLTLLPVGLYSEIKLSVTNFRIIHGRIFPSNLLHCSVAAASKKNHWQINLSSFSPTAFSSSPQIFMCYGF